LEAEFHHRKRPVGRSWRLDETYIKVKGEWRYLYRAVDTTGQTIDVLLTEHRDTEAALRFLTQAIRRHGVPEKISIDGSEANAAAIRSYHAEHGTAIIIRQVKYLNNIIEQDHLALWLLGATVGYSGSAPRSLMVAQLFPVLLMYVLLRATSPWLLQLELPNERLAAWLRWFVGA
jgi:hypothetical protein